MNCCLAQQKKKCKICLFSSISESGVTDHYAQDEVHALHLARRVVKNLNYVKDPGVSNSCYRTRSIII